MATTESNIDIHGSTAIIAGSVPVEPVDDFVVPQGVKQKRKSERYISELLSQYSAILVQPLAAEKKVVWGLFDTTAAERTVCFANAE